MTTQIEITNVPNTIICLENGELQRNHRQNLANRFASLNNLTQQDILRLERKTLGLKDNRTCTTLPVGTDILFRGQLIPAEENKARNLFLKPGESATILYRPPFRENELFSFVTIRRSK